ncbi:uncharacterized protein SPPG_00986 [Spizellomyces punctatus DAOM BR117]|uniref:Uncharacterized protein n=1 Tax=Spizellomyces punctatus (strain DAOM BR117) TaxID=645134 RepID=A0A0L0HQY9_SPIPD|nr:uncharacterized protein SPPG_00986 [Spizellomyces punctatus DAOM BR117]KND03502.1 hypothetical protein SPPG_00986 [Spizellomyces punctatus DAOM BR117]|eukprot:XP_016611541.1 hypothetical protein SPPG_00986 [Spizellomyces punctatus DAOM BR117]
MALGSKKNGGKNSKSQKAKKSINALVLASGTLATPSVPSFFSAIQVHLRPRSKNDGPLKPRALSASRRAQSMSVLSTDTAALAAVKSNAQREPPVMIERRIPTRGPVKQPTPTSDNFRPQHVETRSSADKIVSSTERADITGECKFSGVPVEDNDVDLDFDVEFGFTDVRHAPLANLGHILADENPTSGPIHANTQDNSKNPLTRKSSDRNISPRRIQSAPTGLLKMYDESMLLEDDPTDEWFVPSVKAKAERRLGRGGMVGAEEEEEDEGIKLESWDDDFDVGEKDDLDIPDSVQNLQKHIRGDVVNLKKFALHIEDLKLIFLDMHDMASGIPSNHTQALRTLQTTYNKEIEKAEVLIAIGDYAEDRPQCTAPTARHLRVLAEMLLGGAKGNVLSSQAAEDITRMVEQESLAFGVELVPALMKHMSPLKQALTMYVEQLRQLLLQGNDF